MVIAGLFQPALQCEWTGPPSGDPYPNHIQVLSTPIVADLNLDSNANTIHPYIIFNSYDGLDGDSGVATNNGGVVRIIDGRNCQQLYYIGPNPTGHNTNGCNPPAVADLDGDGVMEIVVHWYDGATEIWGYDALNDQFVQRYFSHIANGTRYTPGATGWGGPSIHDINDDGSPEILSGGIIYSSVGLVIDSSLGLSAVYGSGTGFPVVGDIDRDSIIELPTGRYIYEYSSSTSRWNRTNTCYRVSTTLADPGFTAVADFGTYPSAAGSDNRRVLDGIAEVVVVRSGYAWIESYNCSRFVFGRIALPQSTGGGPPTVGDFDGDQLPEFAAAGSDSYTIFDPDCQGTSPDSAFCASGRTDGILWTKPSQDHSSNITGSSIFDFEGDGEAEAVYADECFVRVYEGKTGNVIYSQWRSSCTWNENPIVVDADNDYNAELVVPSNKNCSTSPSYMGSTSYDTVTRSSKTVYLDPLFRGLRCETSADCPSNSCDNGYCRCTDDTQCGGTGFLCASPPTGTPGTGNTCRSYWGGSVNGVRVYRDILDRWVDTRTIWNQHAYSVTNIEENGTVPRTSLWQMNWLTYNNFRQNAQGDVNPSSINDLTSGRDLLVSCDENNNMTIEVNLCNRGTADAPPNVSVAFYNGDTDDCNIICISTNTMELSPGDCETVSCLWPNAPVVPTDVYVIADDDGTCSEHTGEQGECIEENNMSVIREVSCSSN